MVFQVNAYVSNKRHSFIIEADNIKQVPALLFERMGASDTTILSITPITKTQRTSILPSPKKKKVTLRDLEILCRQLYVLISSGMTIMESIQTLVADRTLNKRLKDALSDIVVNIKSGFSFASSLKGYPGVFNAMFCSTMKAAEESGRIEDALLWLADSFRRDQDFKSKIRQTLSYPAIVVVFAIIIALGLFTFVVPKFINMLVGGGVEIPLITRVMMAISHNIYWIAALLALLVMSGVVFVKLMMKKSESITKFLEIRLIKIPVIGELLVYLTLSRIFWLMSMLLRTGLSLLEVLDILIESLNYVSFKHELILAKTSVEKGNRFAAGFENSLWVRPIEQRMLSIGEQSGSLEKMSEYAASLLEKEAEAVMARMPPLIETATTVMVGVGVLVVLLSLFLPMFSIYKTVN